MSKYVKGLVQAEVEKKLGGITTFLVINTMGIDGIINNRMRGELRKKGINLLVVKNSLARKALDNMGMKGASSLLSGPCTLAYGGDSVVDIAKDFVEIIKKVKKVEIKGAYVEGIGLDAKGAVELAKMPNRRQLQGQIVMLICSGGSRIAGSIISPASRIAGCIKAIIEKGEAA